MRRYVLLGQIGRGGDSVVYQALDTVRARPMAIKMLDPARASDTKARERIRREALITDRMRHPSVPRIYDFGDAPLGDGTVVPYVVMELLSGTVLAGQLASGPLPWREAVSVAATVADVLAVAHRRGVVHRDLTPGNIMMTRTGAKIIDFGLAVTVDTDESEDGLYLPPGKARPNEFAGPGEPADDVYALGVLLYQLLTGDSPFPDMEQPVLDGGSSRLKFMAPTPIVNVPGMPREVAEICRACMSKRPSERPESATIALGLWSMIVEPKAIESASADLYTAYPAPMPVVRPPVRQHPTPPHGIPLYSASGDSAGPSRAGRTSRSVIPGRHRTSVQIRRIGLTPGAPTDSGPPR